LFAIDKQRRKILFSDGPELKGVAYELFVRLADRYREDRRNDSPKSKYSFISTKEFAESLKIDQLRLRVRLHSARASLARQFEEAIDYTIDEQDIIQSRRWGGYRLNPYLVLVEPADLRPPRKTGPVGARTNDTVQKTNNTNDPH
jgi:hypothetical protein